MMTETTTTAGNRAPAAGSVPVFSVAVETDKYLAVSAKLQIEDIDWKLARQAGVTPNEVWMITYFSDIEVQTVMYMRDLLDTEAALEADVMGFLTMWTYEEFFHGKALARLLQECGHPLDTSRAASVRKSRSFSEVFESLAATALSKVLHAEFPAVHATWGAVQEITTLHAYEELGKMTRNPVLKTLCERIAKQERRHFAWYFNSARDRLAKSSRAQRLTRMLLKKFWSPVGAGVKNKEEVARMIGLLFPGEIAVRVANDIDSKIGSLPGLSDLGLMVPYMEKNLVPGQS